MPNGTREAAGPENGGTAPSCRPWSREELAVLAQHYPHRPAAEICKLLPGRSRHAIIGKANSIGLKKTAYMQAHPPNRKDADVDALLDLRASGTSVRELMARFGLSKTTCKARLRRAREAGDPRAAKRQDVHTDLDIDALLDMRQAGMSRKEISVRLGISEATYDNRLREARAAGDPRAAKRQGGHADLDVDALLDMRQAGMDRKTICARLGIGETTYDDHVRAAREAGDPRAARSCRARADLDADALLNMRQAGMDRKTICAELGISRSAYTDLVREAREAGDPRAAKRTGTWTASLADAGLPAYTSLDELARSHGLRPTTLQSRLDRGEDPRTALTRIPDGTVIDGRLVIVSHIEDGYHAVRFDGHERVWAHGRILRYLREERKPG